MKTSQRGIQLIQDHEGGPFLEAYLDPVGIPTIGWGHTKNVVMGQTITRDQALGLLHDDLFWAETAVNDYVKIPLTQNQFDALVSFVFNLGAGKFKDSTLLKKINEGLFAAAAEEFPRWNKGKIKGEFVELPGLTRRRKDERRLFMTDDPTYPTAAAPVSDSAKELGKKVLESPITKFALAAINPILAAAPEFIKLFTDKSGKTVPERNVEAAVKMVAVAQQALEDSGRPTPNAQAVAEAVESDPAAREVVRVALMQRYFDITEAGGGGIAGAAERDFKYISIDGPWWQIFKSPSFWALLLMLPLVYIIVLSIVGVVGSAEWSSDVRAAIAGTIVGSIVGGAVGYYWGQTTSRNRTPG